MTQDIRFHNSNNEISLQELKDVANFYELANYFEEPKITVSYNTVKMSCPFHKEKTPSFFYSIEKKFYYCHGCKANGDIFDYVIHKKGCSFKDAVKFILDFFNIQKSISQGVITKASSFKKELAAINKYKRKAEKDFTYFQEEDIEKMIEFRKGITLKTIFSEETLDFFECGLDVSEKRLVLPIRDEHGKLIGATGRTFVKDFKEKDIVKWKHYKNSNTGLTFFNIKNAIKESKLQNNSIIIVEGPKDVMWLHQNGFKNTVACLTNTLGDSQKGVLLKNCISVYVFLDGDAAGATGTSVIVDKLKGYFNLYIVDIPKEKDPDDLSKEELEYVIKTARKVS